MLLVAPLNTAAWNSFLLLDMKFKPKPNGRWYQLQDNNPTSRPTQSSLFITSSALTQSAAGKLLFAAWRRRTGGKLPGEKKKSGHQAVPCENRPGRVVAVLQEHQVSLEPDGFGPSQNLVCQRVGLTSAGIEGSLPARRPLGWFGLATIFFWFVCFNHSQAASITQSCALPFLLQTQQLSAQTNLSHQRSIMPSNKQREFLLRLLLYETALGPRFTVSIRAGTI